MGSIWGHPLPWSCNAAKLKGARLLEEETVLEVLPVLPGSSQFILEVPCILHHTWRIIPFSKWLVTMVNFRQDV